MKELLAIQVQRIHRRDRCRGQRDLP